MFWISQTFVVPSFTDKEFQRGESMILSLNGAWRVKDLQGELSFEGKVPGVVQQDLIEKGIFPHPYVGDNEDVFSKLERKDWMYERTFEFNEEISDEEEVDLVFEGIDTLGKIFLNGIFLGKTENMFLEYRFDVKNVLKRENEIKVLIESPVNVPESLEKTYGRLGGLNPIRGYIRKAQYSYGWDWGARIVTSGIWKPVYIEKYKIARVHDSTAYILDTDGKSGMVVVTGIISSNRKLNAEDLSVLIIVDGEEVGRFPVFSRNGEYWFKGVFKMENVQLWYPRGIGPQKLYDFSFILLHKGEEVYEERKKIGLRTVKIIKERDEEGRTFIFEINGEKVFVKGANWIPGDNILTWMKDEDYKKLLKMAYDAGMNMLRVWGGGIYERDVFYETCDELGIMIWQDFMFACLEYPDHLPWFRKLANEEIRRIVRKLRYHPSIVLWCGNNENNWGFEEWGNMTRKVDGYNLGNRLYLIDFPKICSEEDPSREYWVSSPYGGEKVNSPKEGDRHNWIIWSAWVDFEFYEKDTGRFISEFGFQGAPHHKTIDFFLKPDEKYVFHPVMVKHEKQEEGLERCLRFINGRFGIVNDFDSFVYLSQLNQAEAIKFGVEHWRTRKYRTSGVLYWQFNDSWPVVSWSAVDYFKRPKALYYYTKRFYSEILPVIKFEKGDRSLSLIVVSDLKKTVEASVSLEIYDFDGNLILEKRAKIVLPKDSVVEIFTVDVSFLNLQETIAFSTVEVEGRSFKNYKVFERYRNMNLKDPELSWERVGDTIKISAKKPAIGVHVVSEHDEKLEDNFFFLKPGETKVLQLVDGEFVVESLYDHLPKK